MGNPMTEISDDDVEATLDAWAQQPLHLLNAHSVAADLDLLPTAWRPIALATDPAIRRTTALALWGGDLLALLPNLAQILHERLADVRVCLTGGTPALVYVVAGDYERWVTWIGYDPRTFGTEPPFWELFPAELRSFLREVHAGFVSREPDRYGPVPPREMLTMADRIGVPEAIEDFDDVNDIAAARLLVLAREGELMYYCVSPDAEPGEIVQFYEGDIDARPFWPALDKVFPLRLETR
jgi:hypothetical protein